MSQLQDINYIWLFFFYGLSFFIMGTSALQQKFRHKSEFPLLTSIQLLGAFGVLHGLAEWVSMLRIMQAYDNLNWQLYAIETFLTGFSFLFLMIFGFSMVLKETTKNIKVHIWVPLLLMSLWSFFFLGRIFSVPEDLMWQITLFNNIARYFMGLPGAFLAGISFFQNGIHLNSLKLNNYAKMYMVAGALFLLYGISAGLIIAPLNIFPAYLVNREMFLYATGFPIEVVRAISAIGITVMTIKIFDSFSWEIQRRLNEYEQQQLLIQDRKKTIQMVHDQIIQRLFGAGMLVESLMDITEDDDLKEGLNTLKTDLNQTILEARQFLKTFSSSYMGIEDFKENLYNLVERFRFNSQTNCDFEYLVPSMVLGRITEEKNTELYYIIQEALMNIQKHAKAQNVRIRVYSNLKEIIAEIEDDGVGFTMTHDNTESYGIKNMKDRAHRISGRIEINSNREGTRVIVRVPWEERKS
ncbi:MAG: hypothetical protein D5S00_06225 [Tindallia sp. MSAO_Bac2]|nr:MAG: hypothetical protein D5S00_06225 [Tindallia sp. MSAO_Bac2]